MLGDFLHDLRLRWRGMRPTMSMDCARCPSILGGSHLRVTSWSFMAAGWRLRRLMHAYGWRDGGCPYGHQESTRIEGWLHGLQAFVVELASRGVVLVRRGWLIAVEGDAPRADQVAALVEVLCRKPGLMLILGDSRKQEGRN
jgi:hypothetical protein